MRRGPGQGGGTQGGRGQAGRFLLQAQTATWAVSCLPDSICRSSNEQFHFLLGRLISLPSVITAGCLSFLRCWPGRHIICPTGMTLFRR